MGRIVSAYVFYEMEQKCAFYASSAGLHQRENARDHNMCVYTILLAMTVREAGKKLN